MKIRDELWLVPDFVCVFLGETCAFAQVSGEFARMRKLMTKRVRKLRGERKVCEFDKTLGLSADFFGRPSQPPEGGSSPKGGAKKVRKFVTARLAHMRKSLVSLRICANS